MIRYSASGSLPEARAARDNLRSDARGIAECDADAFGMRVNRPRRGITTGDRAYLQKVLM